jgi:serine phosphatase RsbU (regulator of sigma subunit)/anti-sigma regulatory factor (Ser/Thr protein kinase)
VTASAGVWRVTSEAAEARAAARAVETPLDEARFDIAPNDPIIAYFQSAPGAVDIGTLQLDSPALTAMRAAGVKLVVPLVSQGELIGLLKLGPRLSEQEYSLDDRRLLEDLASHAAPALRVAELVREQEAEIRARERLEQELHVAQLIQQNFLPKQTPQLGGWRVAAYYRPARAVGGDFYDFIDLPEGKLGLVIGDVTDKGVPAALVMAATRSVLRAAAQRLVSPAAVLERVNEATCGDIPRNMFVTCLYAVLDPASGRIVYANAGHNPPYVHTLDGVAELRATGMPLGLMPGVRYDEKEARIEPGQSLLLHSDGLVEAHNQRREMFGFPRLAALVGAQSLGEALIDTVLERLDEFVGSGWVQEDDITLVSLDRTEWAAMGADGARTLAEFEIPSVLGNEKEAIARVEQAVRAMGLREVELDRLKTAVGEATMNAIEHGNRKRAELPVTIRVSASEGELVVAVTDRGGRRAIPEAQTPDLEAKLQGLQSPRGWGLFLIKNMVDDMRVSGDGRHHTIELVLRRKGEQRGNE